jgi:hypothetical protein
VLKIQRSSNGQVTYMLSGQIEEEDIDGLEAAHSNDVDQSIRFDADQIGAKRRKALSV